MVIACGLTIVVVVGALLFPQREDMAASGLSERATTITLLWFNGIWNAAFLTFALQMCVVLLTGYGLAKAPPAVAVLRYVATRVKTNRAAVLCVAAVSCVGCWINWGFGLIAAGILATELRAALERRGVKCRYALIVAGAYSGMMIWHGGLSGSAPLKVAEQGVSITRTADGSGARHTLDPIDVSQTVLAPTNLFLSVLFLIGVPLVLRAMAPAEDGRSADPGGARQSPATRSNDLTSQATLDEQNLSLADRANRSRLIPAMIALIAVFALGILLRRHGTQAIGLNFVNTVFLILGLALHRNLGEYVSAVAEGGRAVTGIVMQFPLYGGIQAVMFGTGLAVSLSVGFVRGSAWVAEVTNLSTGTTFPVGVFFSAAVVNLFVPSGGGQWIVQGPIMCGAADALRLPIAQTVMAVSYGDEWTNMIQPFWAIPLMGLTGVNARKFIGYCALLMLLSMPVFVLALVLLY